MQYTIEYRNDTKELQLHFLDATIRNNLNHKLAITNVKIKQYSNVCPNITLCIAVFK